jgi:serine palmitoyltransferase
LYAYSFAAISSAIPSYAKRGDVIFADEHVNFAIQRGLIASRSEIRFFKHNDVEDFTRLLKLQKEADVQNPVKAKAIRRFCVVEGIYSKTGLICPLKEISELCLEYKVRLFVDESISFGALGQTGRGVTEYLNVPRENIDFISGSLEQGLGAFGGFIVGSSYVVDHQRISGLGYCFSASLPPMLAGAGIQALKLIEANPQLIEELQNNCEYMDSKLRNLSDFTVSGHPLSPVKHLSLKKSFGSRKTDKILLKDIAFHVRENAKIAVVMPAYLEKEEKTLLAPSIRIAVNRLLTLNEMDDVVTALKEAANVVLSKPEMPDSDETKSQD